MKSLTAIISIFAFVLTVLPAQAKSAIRQLVRNADFVGFIQAEPLSYDPHSEWRQSIMLLNAEAIKGNLKRDYGSNPFPYIQAAHAGFAGFPTDFSENGEYLVVLHSTGTGSNCKWTTLAAFRVQYYPNGFTNFLDLQSDDVTGLMISNNNRGRLASGATVTVAEARQWVVNIINNKKMSPSQEAEMDAFFDNTLQSRGESENFKTPVYKERYTLAKKLADAITPGMTRRELEKIFPQSDGGAFGSDRWRYYFGADVMVGVPYDTTGGPFQPENKVTGPLNVYRDMMHYD